MALVVRPGRSGEAALLSDLALRSKAFWGYDEQLSACWRAELTLAPAEVTVRRTAVAELDDRVVGFVTVDGNPPAGELGMLFVVPEAIGKGVGGELFRHAVETAGRAGFHRLIIESDPNAEPFYRAMGAVRVGSVASGAVPGRELPMFEVDTLAALPMPLAVMCDRGVQAVPASSTANPARTQRRARGSPSGSAPSTVVVVSDRAAPAPIAVTAEVSQAFC